MENRNKTIAKISAATVGAAMLIAIPFIKTKEGNSLEAYEDVAGIWTICGGIAGVEPGTKMTAPECEELTRSTISRFMVVVAKMIKVEVPAEVLAAHTSLSYNIGIGAYSRSSALRLTNEGKIEEGCNAILKWKFVGEKDCSIKSNGCLGVWIRRVDEKLLCLKGIKQGGENE